jgi:Na+-translocating ferredoxin:NAD+ oxidoreductase RNF subunit RnfB
MRVRKDINQKLLSELFYQYITVEDDFIKSLFIGGDTQLGRFFINEPALSSDNSLHVLEYEKASHVIKTASHIAIGVCYCRHKMKHLGKACDAPMEICMTFNDVGKSLIKHKVARQVDVAEGLDLLQTAYDHNLVQFGENAKEGVNFICNCCSCCCEAVLAARHFGSLLPIHTTHFIPVINEKKCTGCGKCVSICPVEALNLVSANNPSNKKKAKLDKKICLGCGVCIRNCPNDCLKLTNRKKKIITPLDSVHKTVMMAI